MPFACHVRARHAKRVVPFLTWPILLYLRCGSYLHAQQEVRDLKEKLAAAEGWCKEMQKQLDAAQASHAAETRRQRLEADLAQARRDAQ